jgi:hypothetical protein
MDLKKCLKAETVVVCVETRSIARKMKSGGMKRLQLQ